MYPLIIRGSLACIIAVSVSGCGRSRPDRAAAPPPAPQGIITAEDMERTPTQTIEQLLMARVPGILVTRTPDGGIAIRLRGSTSVYGRQEPLYVINDVPIEPGPYGSLTGINPYDIESIQVLRDAASTTLYGMRGANGVILIRTKSPGQ